MTWFSIWRPLGKRTDLNLKLCVLFCSFKSFTVCPNGDLASHKAPEQSSLYKQLSFPRSPPRLLHTKYCLPPWLLYNNCRTRVSAEMCGSQRLQREGGLFPYAKEVQRWPRQRRQKWEWKQMETEEQWSCKIAPCKIFTCFVSLYI